MQVDQKSNDQQTLPKSAENIGSNQKEFQSLKHISLRELKLRNKQTENAIQAVEARINYFKNKQQKTVKKVLHVKRKLTSLEQVKIKAKEMKEMSQQERKKMEDGLSQKAQFNKLIKDHLKYNKKIVMTLLNHKVNEQSRNFKEKLDQLSVLNQIQKENAKQQAAEKANRVRMEHIQAHQKRKLYFLDKLQQFKQFKEQKLKEQLRQRQRQQMMINELEEKQRLLLERLSVSQKFRLKCQQQFEEAKQKYHSFYEASKGLSRGMSRQSSVQDRDERKADIFIS